MERDAPAQALVQGKTLQEGRHTSVWAAFLLFGPHVPGACRLDPEGFAGVTLYTAASCCTL